MKSNICCISSTRKNARALTFPSFFLFFFAGKSSVYVTWIQPANTGLGDDTSLNLQGHEVLSLLALLVKKYEY
jgi:hypothetical protein